VVTHLNLGGVLFDLALLNSGEERNRYLKDAVISYNIALRFFTREMSASHWARMKKNLAKAYFLLEDWVQASNTFSDFLQYYPDDEEAYFFASALYHDILFRFDDAFSLNQRWLERHPDDPTAQPNFAEKLFTTGRFAECRQFITLLLANQKIPIYVKTSLRAIEIAALLTDSQNTQPAAKIDELIAEVSNQPTDFEVKWNFNGVKHFIDQNEKLSPYRVWLKQLFDALKGNREMVLRNLQETKAKFKK
jgi:tetratricopeptide (TPR) repeat protein